MGCDDLPGKPDPADRFRRPSDVMDFHVLFSKNCSGCHGAEGTGGPAPPLNDPLFLGIVSDEELLATVRDGREHTPMPGFSKDKGGTLTDPQIEVLAWGLKRQWGKGKPPANAPPYEPGEGVKGDKDGGEWVFAQACACCHGNGGEGKKVGGRRIGAVNDPAFLGLISDKALRRYVITGRPDLGMPDYASGVPPRPKGFQPLTSQDAADVVALLRSWQHADGK